MNKWITSLFAVALTSSAAFADVAAPALSAKDLEKVVDEAIYVETNTKGVVLSGYVDAGYVYNFNGSNAANYGNAVDNNPRGDFNLNAFKLTLQKALSDKNEFQAGFRADVKIGEDAQILGGNGGAAGSSDTISLDQAYVIVRAPIGNGLDITAGKFASLLGYEVDDRPANLNISFGYDYFFQTSHQTGVKLYYPVNDIVELQFAISNGSGLDSNSSVVGGLTDHTDAYGATGTINIKAPGGNANWFNGIYAAHNANDGLTSGPLLNGSANDTNIQWNSWGNWAPKFANDKLLLGFSNTVGGSDYLFWNASLYAKYQFTDIFSLASRTSYLHSIDNDSAAPTGFAFAPINGDAYSYTLTAGFNLLENLLVRAEYRVDLFDDAASELANSVSAQVVYTF